MGPSFNIPIKGRGSAENPANRFEHHQLERDSEWDGSDDPAPRTRFYRDLSQTIITTNDSPEIGGSSLNPYRGCEHGCVYCYARPTHEYLGLSAGIDFESKIFVKTEAPMLLRKALMANSWKPQTLMMSGVTDCYQPVERRLKITRGCLEVLAEFRNPVALITKNWLVTRDIDVLRELARFEAVSVTLSVTTIDDDLASVMEPRTARPKARLEAIRLLSNAGISVGVNIAPVIPGLTDLEIPSILEASRRAGAAYAGYTVLRLPYAVKDLFQAWLDRHRPQAKDKILHRIREIRGGKLYDASYGTRMTGTGPYAQHLADLFHIAKRRAGFPEHRPHLSSAAFRRPGGTQIEMFAV